jgi:hypothetical protein
MLLCQASERAPFPVAFLIISNCFQNGSLFDGKW